MTKWRKIQGNPKVFDRLVELSASGDAVGFIGAGASAGLYPLWPQLIERLANAAIDAGQATEAEKQAWCTTMDSLMAARQIRGRAQRALWAPMGATAPFGRRGNKFPR